FDYTYADNPIQTGIESSTRSSSDVTFAMDDFRTEVGFETSARQEFFDRYFDLNSFNASQKVDFGSDWATTIFVFKNGFENGDVGWAEIGGPWMVLAGEGAIKKEIVAHELGHLFGALDEYEGGHGFDQVSGVYATQNTNAYDGNPDPDGRVPSIMDDPFEAWDNHDISDAAAAMVGWKDTDIDGVFDVLDIPLDLAGSGNYDSSANQYTFEGFSQAVAFDNQSPHPFYNTDVSINTIDEIQYRLNGGEWISVLANGESSTEVDLDFGEQLAGQYDVEIRTVDSDTGVTSNTVSDNFVVVPNVEAIRINDGESQRSTLSSVSVTFNGEVSLDEGVFTLVQRSNESGTTGTNVAIAYTTELINGKTVATITFLDNIRNDFGALVTGNYQLTVDAEKVRLGNSSFEMAADEVFGNVEEHGFYTLFGDFDGDRDVDNRDRLFFRRAFRSSLGDSNYEVAFDYDGDGDIDSRDKLRFRINKNKFFSFS
ncbi:MAG: dockerin type I domain-containing protein, partial [Planctomycetota bacterium]